jgi:hypothetical protein
VKYPSAAQLIFALRIGAKYTSHKVLNIYKNRLGDAWIAESLSATTVAH